MTELVKQDFSDFSAAEQLACDEALLDFSELTQHPGMLRFWEARAYFVVLGYGNRLQTEVHVEECERLGIPILRRCSGGGTVLQGPGCMNYTLCLPIEAHPGLESISGANRFIMERNRKALAETSGLEVRVQGFTDLTVEGVKFSGNAQRRKRSHLLFHGSLLIDFDLHLVEKILRFPTHQPDYRKGRAHRDFIRNFPLRREEIWNSLETAWDVRGEIGISPEILERIQELVTERYGNEDWSRKF